MSWLTIAQNISTFITSQFGAVIIAIAVAVAGGRAALHGHWGHFWSAVGGGGVLVGASWFVSTFLGGAGG